MNDAAPVPGSALGSGSVAECGEWLLSVLADAEWVQVGWLEALAAADLHHDRFWTDGGPTDVDNGHLQCPRHHTMLHHGCTTSGDPNHDLHFHRPDGSYLGTTRPALVGAG